jgi:cysteinyl-tRNA synthetase
MQRIRNVEKDKNLSGEEKRAIFLYADRVLALDLSRKIEIAPLSAELQELLSARDEARKNKDWKLSDELRQTLEGHGLIIKDKTDGQEWSWA